MLFLYCLAIATGYLTVVFYYFTKLIASDENPDINNISTWSEHISNCHYINLDRHAQKRNRMLNLMNHLGIPATRFQAVDGTLAIKQYPDSALTRKDLGRKLSHFHLINNATLNKWNIVFEDTAYVPTNRFIHFLQNLPKSAMLIHFAIQPTQLLYKLLTFKLYRHSERIWFTENPQPILHAYAITHEGAKRWTHAIECNFFDKPIHKHTQGINTVYIAHKASRWIDFFHILTLKDMSHITNNPNALLQTL